MSVVEQTTQPFVSGTHNLLSPEVIPQDAASDSLNWLTRDGSVELAYGRQLEGNVGVAGKIYGEHFGYRADGTAVHFRKADSAIQVLVSGTWTDVITGLTTTADYVFSNYQSLAGAFTYCFGVDGIYKIATANPTSYTSLYDSTKNFKGYAFIDRARTIMWGLEKDPTGLYGSWIDGQTAVSGSTGVYTTVSGEATASLSGTLAFKASGSTRTCFAVVITLTGSGEVYTDNYNGVLVGSLGGTGTINYTSGAYTLSASGTGTAAYQWENSNLRGVTDFSKSATRLAGEGFVIRQDAGGDAIVTVIPLAGSYFSLKKNSSYKFTLDTTDTAPVNEIYRTDIGVPFLRAATGTGSGIVFMNTANPSHPQLWTLKENPLGDTFDAIPLFSQYDFTAYTYDTCIVDFWDRYVLIACKLNSDDNNRLLLGDVQNNSVDATYYGARSLAKNAGLLYAGDSVSATTYNLFSGFDDLGVSLENNWDSKAELFGSNVLKKERRIRFRGKIAPNQSIGVYMQFDGQGYTLVGTILGSGDYVDYATSYAIGTTFVGQDTLGGGGGGVASVYRFFLELHLKNPKFRKRNVRFKALGIGYASIEMITDFDLLTYEDRMPKANRLKQNVALAGTPTDQANPEY